MEFKNVNLKELPEYLYKLENPDRYIGEKLEDNFLKINKNITKSFVENLDKSQEIDWWSINHFSSELETDIYTLKILKTKTGEVLEEQLITFVPYFSTIMNYEFLADETLLKFKTNDIARYYDDFWKLDRVYKRIDKIVDYCNKFKIKHFIFDEIQQKFFIYQFREKLH